MAPLLAGLVGKGLGLIAEAVIAKGKDVVEEKLGIKLEPDMTDEQVMTLRQLELQHEAWLIEASIRQRQQEIDAERVMQEEVTKRWSSDMLSDSWLSKNIRPMVLIYLLTAYTILSLMSAFNYNVSESYVELLGQWGMLVMTAYFGGRTVEKVIGLVKGSKEGGKL